MEWVKDWNTNLLKKVIFHISYVDVHIGTPGSSNWVEGKREEKDHKELVKFEIFVIFGFDFMYLSLISVRLLNYNVKNVT